MSFKHKWVAKVAQFFMHLIHPMTTYDVERVSHEDELLTYDQWCARCEAAYEAAAKANDDEQ